MKLLIDGWKTDIRFSAAHFIPGHTKCKRLHGHDYALIIEVYGTPVNGMIADFGEIKRKAREAIAPLDHRLLLPGSGKHTTFKENGNAIDIHYDGISMSIPKEFVAIIDTDSTSSEEISRYICIILKNSLSDFRNITSISVSAQEGPGQGAFWSEEF